VQIHPLSTVCVNFRVRTRIKFSEKKVESLFILAFCKTGRDRMRVSIIGNKCLIFRFTTKIGHFELINFRLRFRVSVRLKRGKPHQPSSPLDCLGPTEIRKNVVC